MKILQKITMKDIVNPLNDPEMKAVRGGYYGSGGYPPPGGSGYDNPYSHCVHICRLMGTGPRQRFVAGVHCQEAWTECRDAGAAAGYGDLWLADCDPAPGCSN